MIEFRGRVDRIIFENDGFYIFTFRTGTQEIKAKGTFMGTAIRPHQDLVLKGDWKRSKWGNDFSVTSFEEVEPSDVEGITRYLQANVKGVGWVTAKRVAEYFGEGTVEVLTNSPDRIFECGFLNAAQAQLIRDTLTKNLQYRDISVFLMSFDVTATMVKRIYEIFGNEAKDILTEDPYKLTKVRGIGFKKADEIAIRMGIDPKAPVRIKAVIKYILEDVISVRGHLYQTREKLRKESKELLGNCRNDVYEECLQEVMTDGDVHIDGRRVYAYKHFFSESRCAELLSEMMTPVNRDFDLEGYIAEYEAAQSKPNNPFRLSDEQVQALELALVSKVLVITGLPGTGKTTVLKAIVGMFEKFLKGVRLMTPTGISSKRLKQVTGRQAGTIHRTLGCRGDGQWASNPDNPLSAEGIIVDEFSMVDQGLFYRLLSGIRQDATLILVGDSAQLPSVGPGNVLSEVVRSGCVSAVELTTIHRQEEASDIVLNAHRINSGQALVLDTKSPATDFKFFKLKEEEVILERLVYVTKKLHAKGVNLQVLSPRHKGTVGVASINDALREALNPDIGQPSATIGKKSFRVGDRVMVTRNRYDHGVFNGDIGNVIQINKKNRTVQFLVDGNSLPTVFEYNDAREDLVLAYCVTIHKCVHPDTLTESEHGLLPICLLSGIGTIATPEGVRDYTRKVVNRKGKALRIETESGYTLTVTPEHGIDAWCSDNGEYVRTKAVDLVEGDWLRLKVGITVEPTLPVVLPPAPTSLDVRTKLYSVPAEMTSAFAEWLGLFVADGTLYRAGFRLVKRHQDVVDRFAELTEHLFDYPVKVGTVTGGYPMAEVNSVFLSRWLESLGGLSPSEKAVPVCVLASTSAHHAAFLRGLFEDGSVGIKDGKLDNIELRQCQPRILEVARVMLLRLGIIVSKFRGKFLRYDNIVIYGSHASRFMDRVGFVSSYKTRMGSEAIQRTSDSRNRIPVTREQANHLHTEHPHEFGIYLKQNTRANGYMSRDIAALVCPELLDFHHDRIVSITEVECPSVCVEVPEGHRFLQNGFSGWNSQGSEWDFVLMPMVTNFSIQLQRNLFYTAVTRARRKVMVFGHSRAMNKAIANDRVQRRNTIFAERLQNIVAMN